MRYAAKSYPSPVPGKQCKSCNNSELTAMTGIAYSKIDFVCPASFHQMASVSSKYENNHRPSGRL